MKNMLCGTVRRSGSGLSYSPWDFVIKRKQTDLALSVHEAAASPGARPAQKSLMWSMSQKYVQKD